MKLDEISPKTRIAHVGAGIDPGGDLGDNDRWHMDAVFSWLKDNGADYKRLYYDNRDDDFIDLNDGRDFLDESHKYDIVILHMVYSSSEPWRERRGLFLNSRAHSKDNWRRRLRQTGAEYIFTFGDLDEVSGEYLGRLMGYDGPLDGGNYLSAYVRQ